MIEVLLPAQLVVLNPNVIAVKKSEYYHKILTRIVTLLQSILVLSPTNIAVKKSEHYHKILTSTVTLRQS